MVKKSPMTPKLGLHRLGSVRFHSEARRPDDCGRRRGPVWRLGRNRRGQVLNGQPKRIRKYLYPLVAAVSVAALAACSSGGGSVSATGAAALSMPGPSGPLETHTITVAAVPTADEAGLYIANDLGYFKQQGLTVNISITPGGELAIPDLTSGKADLVAGNYVSFVQAQMEHQANLRIIANGSQMQTGNQALYVMPGSNIKSVADLVRYHARIGVNTKNNIGTLLIGSLLQDNGFSLSQLPPLYAPAGGFP